VTAEDIAWLERELSKATDNFAGRELATDSFSNALRREKDALTRILSALSAPTPEKHPDTVRLDWLARQRFAVEVERWYDDETDSYPWNVRVGGCDYAGDTCRAAIDAALSAQQEGK